MDWDRYFYRSKSKEEMIKIAHTLEYFRFCRAYGGHANDGDKLIIKIKYKDSDDLYNTLKAFEVKVRIYDSKPAQPIPGKSYSVKDFSSFPSLIKGTRWFEQPGHCKIFGINVFIYCLNNEISISTNGGSYEVLEEHIENAKILENKLIFSDYSIIEPPQDDKHCLCPKYYPQIFKTF